MAPTPPTPLPYKRVLVLLSVVLAEGVAMNCLYPFVAFMVADLGVTSSKQHLGYFAGWLASAFLLGQFASSFVLGRLSDKHGRRPILLGGLVANSILLVLFGMSKSLWVALLTRAANGIANGNFAVSKVYLREISDQSNQTSAFRLFGLTWGMATVIGPIIGGLLARPAIQYPSLVGKDDVLGRFPYLLPCIVSSIISVLSLMAAFFWLDETLKPPTLENFGQKSVKSKTRSSLKQPLLDDRQQSDAIPPAAAAPGAAAAAVAAESSGGAARNQLHSSATRKDRGKSQISIPPGMGDSAVRLKASHKEALSDANEFVAGGDPTLLGSRNQVRDDFDRVSARDSRIEQERRAKVLRAEFRSDPHPSLKKKAQHPSINRQATAYERAHIVYQQPQRFLPGLAETHWSFPDSAGGVSFVWGEFAGEEKDESDEDEEKGISMNDKLINGDQKPLQSPDTASQASVRSLFCVRSVVLVAISFVALRFVATVGSETFSLWAVTDIVHDGIEFTTRDISLCFIAQGIALSCWQLFVFKKLVRRLGPVRVFQLALGFAAVLACLPPYLHILRRDGHSVAFWICLMAIFAGRGAVLASGFTTSALLLNNCAPVRTGAIVGLVEMLAAAGRAAGPFLGGTLLAWSETNGLPQPLDYHFIFWLLSLVALMGCVTALLLPDELRVRIELKMRGRKK